MEAAWFVRACETFGIPRERLVLHSHTTTPQVFAPEIALAVCVELERVGGAPWYDVMFRNGLAEYETYAAFARHRWTGHRTVEPRDFTASLVLTQWHDPASAEALLAQLRDRRRHPLLLRAVEDGRVRRRLARRPARQDRHRVLRRS